MNDPQTVAIGYAIAFAAGVYAAKHIFPSSTSASSSPGGERLPSCVFVCVCVCMCMCMCMCVCMSQTGRPLAVVDTPSFALACDSPRASVMLTITLGRQWWNPERLWLERWPWQNGSCSQHGDLVRCPQHLSRTSFMVGHSHAGDAAAWMRPQERCTREATCLLATHTSSLAHWP
jgi:hypothetical protein